MTTLEVLAGTENKAKVAPTLKCVKLQNELFEISINAAVAS